MLWPLSTTQYGDDHVKEVEELWGALCHWRKNMHIAINFLIHNARTSCNPILLQQVKKIIVFFARAQQQEIVEEVINDMKVGAGGDWWGLVGLVGLVGIGGAGGAGGDWWGWWGLVGTGGDWWRC